MLVAVKQAPDDAKALWICSYHLAAADSVLSNEASPLEDRDVLLHCSEAHRVMAGKLGDALLAIDRTPNDVPPGSVRERGEDMIDVLSRYNHTVVLYEGRRSYRSV